MSIKSKAAENHAAAAAHRETAAQHHAKAATQREMGDRQRAAHHAQIAHGQMAFAARHVALASEQYAQQYSGHADKPASDNGTVRLGRSSGGTPAKSRPADEWRSHLILQDQTSSHQHLLKVDHIIIQ